MMMFVNLFLYFCAFILASAHKIFFLNLKIIQANKSKLKKIWLKLQPFCLGGETGRRARLKIWYGQPCVGSSPTRGTRIR